MDERSASVSPSRRKFLRRVGLAAGGTLLVLAGCGRGFRRAPPARSALPQPSFTAPVPTAIPATPTAQPAATSIPSSAPPTPVVAASERAADLVLANGKVVTIDPADTIAQAVAVKDGRILAVGTDEMMRALAGEKTQWIDLRGRTLTPGLIDSHNHLQVQGQLQGHYIPFLPPEVRSVDDLKARLKDVVAATPEGEWIQGYFLVVNDGRLPNRQDLDPVSPKNPVWILQQGGHYGSANSQALKLAGIDASIPDPVGGVIERDARGEPTGVFYNHRAMDMLRRVAPGVTPEMVAQFIADTQPLFAACGVTSFQDNNVRGVDTVGAYLDAGKQDKMTLRGAVYYTLEWPADVDRALNQVERYQDDHMRFAGFKFLLDGQAQMAYCHQPHNGVRWDLPTWEPGSFKDAVRLLHDTGLQICVHCVGDAAVDLTLDAYEAAMNANPRNDPRHRIEHCILSTPEATRRMKDLGVVVSTQPQFLRMGAEGYTRLFGEERARRAIVTREWLEGGVHLALGSDAPTTPWYAPVATLAGAVVRMNFSGGRHVPEQALTISEAMRAHTLGSAYAAHEETIKGSIEPGKLADMVVWTQDPYTSTLDKLWESPIAITMIGGKIVYQA